MVCSLNSGPVSIIREVCSDSTQTEQRIRIFRGSSSNSSSPNPPATGTPIEVPVPRNVTLIRWLPICFSFNFVELLEPAPDLCQFFTNSRFYKDLFFSQGSYYASQNHGL